MPGPEEGRGGTWSHTVFLTVAQVPPFGPCPWAMPLFLGWQQQQQQQAPATAAGRTQAKQQSAVPHLIVQERNKESQVPANPGRPAASPLVQDHLAYQTLQITDTHGAWYSCVLFLFLQLDAVSLVSTEPSSCCLLYPPQGAIPFPDSRS